MDSGKGIFGRRFVVDRDVATGSGTTLSPYVDIANTSNVAFHDNLLLNRLSQIIFYGQERKNG